MEERIESILAENFTGVNQMAILRVNANVVHAETVTVGNDVFEIDIINTDSTEVTANGDFNNTTNPLDVDMSGYTGLSLSAGDVIRIENEMLLVTAKRKIGATEYTRFSRGYGGTTNATHADASIIYIGDGIAAGSTITVPLVTNLTPNGFLNAFVPCLNAKNTHELRAIKISANECMIYRTVADEASIACSETLAGLNNSIDSALRGGNLRQTARIARATRIPTADEVALGNLRIVVPFDPVAVFVDVRTTTTNAQVAWDGATTITVASGSDSAYVTLDNSGVTDWAETSTVEVLMIG